MYNSEINDTGNKIQGSFSSPYNFSVIARGLGMIALTCTFFSQFYLAFIAGGVAIILAVLSKGSSRRMNPAARSGLISGFLAIAIEIIAIIISMYAIFFIPEYRMQLNSLYEEKYGQSLDESVNIIKERWNIFISEGGNL